MKKNTNVIIAFLAGVSVGALLSYKIADEKYKKIADEEIASVKDIFTDRQPLPQVDPEIRVAEVRKVTPRPDIMNYRNSIKELGYDTVNKQNSKKEVVEDMDMDMDMDNEVQYKDHIYVISPDEFDTLDDYITETLYYTQDNYVLDSDLEILSDAEISNMIDHDPLGHFGEYEDTSVYIRNDELQCDYEILLSLKTCEEIRKES